MGVPLLARCVRPVGPDLAGAPWPLAPPTQVRGAGLRAFPGKAQTPSGSRVEPSTPLPVRWRGDRASRASADAEEGPSYQPIVAATAFEVPSVPPCWTQAWKANVWPRSPGTDGMEAGAEVKVPELFVVKKASVWTEVRSSQAVQPEPGSVVPLGSGTPMKRKPLTLGSVLLSVRVKFRPGVSGALSTRFGGECAGKPV